MSESADRLKLRETEGEPSAALALGLLALFALPLLLIHLGTGDANDMMELFNLVPVKEAYRDGNWLMPTLNGIPRLQKPPLPVWLPAGLAKMVGNDSLVVLRLPSVLAALATCFAVYGIGRMTSKDRRFPLFAAVMLVTMNVFLRQARIASYDIFATAFTTFGLWGLLGMVEAARRRWLWALMAGAALGLANLSKGPVPPATVCLPFGLWMLIYHRKSAAAWGNLLLALAACVAVTAPWFIAIELRLPGAHKTWMSEFLQYSSATGAEYQTTKWYYFGMLAWVMPWTAVLIGGLVMPWLDRAPRGGVVEEVSGTTALERRTRWLFWMILILGAVLLTAPTEKKPRYALQLFPAAALLCGAVWQQYTRLKSGEKVSAAAGILLAAQPLILGGMGVGMLLCVWVGYAGTSWSWLPGKAAEALPKVAETVRPGLDFLGGALFWIPLGLVLVGLAAWTWRLQARRQFVWAFGTFAVGTWLMLLAFNWVYRGVNVYHENRYRQPTLYMMAFSGGRPVYTLRDIYTPWLPVEFYADRILPEKNVAELATLASVKEGPLYVLIPTSTPKANDVVCARAMEALVDLQGKSHRVATPLYAFSDEHYTLTLFQLNAASAPPPGPLPASQPAISR